jgi:hypothetical protein
VSEENLPKVSKVAGMGMKNFCCDMLILGFRFATEEIDQDALIKAAGIENKEEYIDEDGDFMMGVSLDASEEATDYHAHMRIQFYKNGKNLIEITYHSGGIKVEGTRPPHVENCTQWLSNFFKNDKLNSRVMAAYEFDKSYLPVVSLPFPLVTPEKELAGSLVTGLSLVFPPREGGPETAIIQRYDEQVFLSLTAGGDVSLKDFNLLTKLEELSVSVNSLVKKWEAENENRKDSE